MVADTHYYRVLTYTPKGELLTHATLGGTMGQGPGEFGFVTDVVRDAAGNYYVSEYGEFDRIQKFSPDGKFIAAMGRPWHRTPGQFMRPQHLEFDADGLLWVADACNHRIQVFDRRGKLVKMWGTQGSEPGQLQYPYCLVLDGKGHVYVCEYGNHRVQKFTLDGKSVACWGSEGRKPGQLNQPVGAGARQPRPRARARFDESPRAAVCDVRRRRVSNLRCDAVSAFMNLQRIASRVALRSRTCGARFWWRR